MKFTYFLTFMAGVVAAKPTVYLIRHGEKPADDDEVGLSSQGEQRAKCLETVFGPNSQYNIGMIMAQAYKSDGSRERPYLTVEPVAKDLGLTVNVSCDRDDPDCVKDAVDNYNGSGNILIAWEHKEISDIAQTLGADDAEDYPSDRFDLVYVMPYPYDQVASTFSEDCPGLDDNN